jgi:hypothetical protein
MDIAEGIPANREMDNAAQWLFTKNVIFYRFIIRREKL